MIRGKASRRIDVNSEPLGELNCGNNELSEFSAWDGIRFGIDHCLAVFNSIGAGMSGLLVAK
jgi:hypothetical protein